MDSKGILKDFQKCQAFSKDFKGFGTFEDIFKESKEFSRDFKNLNEFPKSPMVLSNLKNHLRFQRISEDSEGFYRNCKV